VGRHRSDPARASLRPFGVDPALAAWFKAPSTQTLECKQALSDAFVNSENNYQKVLDRPNARE